MNDSFFLMLVLYAQSISPCFFTETHREASKFRVNYKNKAKAASPPPRLFSIVSTVCSGALHNLLFFIF